MQTAVSLNAFTCITQCVRRRADSSNVHLPTVIPMRSVGLRTIPKGYVFRECEFAESPGVVVEVDIPLPMLCWAVVGHL